MSLDRRKRVNPFGVFMENVIVRTDELPLESVLDHPGDRRTLIHSFPSDDGFLEASISSEQYKNRSEFIADVHVEYRADLPPQFELKTFVSDTWPHRGVTCVCTNPGAYTRFNLSFSLRGVEAGELIHLPGLFSSR
jgi:hypothetical protein